MTACDKQLGFGTFSSSDRALGSQPTLSRFENSREALTRTFTGPEALRRGTLECARSFNKGRGIMGERKRRMNRDIIRILEEVDPGYIETATLMISP